MSQLVTIYGLVDPREPRRIRYVGQTSRPKERLSKHCGVSYSDSAKSLWIAWLKAVELRPGFVVLAEVPVEVASREEQEWIALFPFEDLLNSHGAPASTIPRPIGTPETRPAPFCQPSENVGQDVPDEVWLKFLQVGLTPA